MKINDAEKARYYNKSMKSCGGSGTIYGLGFLGALIYFLQHAGSFTEGVVGVIYAIFWPGVMVYKVLELLKM